MCQVIQIFVSNYPLLIYRGILTFSLHLELIQIFVSNYTPVSRHYRGWKMLPNLAVKYPLLYIGILTFSLHLEMSPNLATNYTPVFSRLGQSILYYPLAHLQHHQHSPLSALQACIIHALFCLLHHVCQSYHYLFSNLL